MTLDGKPVRRGSLTLRRSGGRNFERAIDLFPIKRGNRLALRMKDKNSALRKSFTHLSWFPVREEWSIAAKFVPLPQHTKLAFDTVIGMPET